MINGPYVPPAALLYTAKMKITLLNVPDDIVEFEYEPEVNAILVVDASYTQVPELVA